jgi:predicted short-subunit dehydrogenase-like oxidoreductase (DUF2520 family)
MNDHSISLVGAGAWGLNLLKNLIRAHWTIHQVVVRDISKFHQVAPFFSQDQTISDLARLEPTDILFIVTPDDVIGDIVRYLPDAVRQNTLVVHSAGSVSIDVISEYCERAGVFYPLQTFTRGRQVELTNVPFFVEATHLADEDLLIQMAKGWSDRVEVMTSNDRLRLHCGAVFASNFVNHCMALADHVISDIEVDFRIYLPIIREVIAKLEILPPEDAQTGPAVRADYTTMSKHLDMLVMSGQEGIASVYTKLNQSIQKLAKEKVHN